MKNFASYFQVISLLRVSLCDRLAGQLVMHYRFMAENTPNNVHLALVMDMAMAERYLYLKESLMANAGKCN